MDYHYETLTDERFQKLVQALIVAEFPNTQCFPVGQPDGGRDAASFPVDAGKDHFIVFQVKFSRTPEAKTERDAISGLVKSEREKVRQLIADGASEYYFVTNVRGTAHRDVGSIDKVNRDLAETLEIPVHVWWRDDVDRRLDNLGHLKWSYPEILKATDVLPLLIQGQGKQNTTRAVTSNMAKQYHTDREVKFKQVELQRNLTDLFVDLPIGHKSPRGGRARGHESSAAGSSEIDAYVNQLDFEDDLESEVEWTADHRGLAGAFLLNMPSAQGVSKFVVEGAPGQGKSTVTQFLCQVHRLRLLKKDVELRRINELHKAALTRVPFRVDLRDYAAWVSEEGVQENSGERIVDRGNTSLESFLALHVTRHSGGLTIEPSELIDFFTEANSVIVLDGFDEVADIHTRERLVKEICEAATRLDCHVKSMQMIVTSRPAAFANSPGFPEEDWIHLELKDLDVENIQMYKDRWIEVQRLDEENARQVSTTLDDKLEQPHVRDLARNPMQLAILLHLIHVQGVALPEKRTALYEEYMKLFFNREAEKSPTVRDHRDLLLLLHGALAWLLHARAEALRGSGSIGKAELRKEVEVYLEGEGHEKELADELLTGTTERVGALVSRIEGTYEFEVQPLREYFAARHLYKTAPYSPPGKTCKGTRPERFQAIARNFYWTNVTRFFCGFYDKGELGGLVDGIVELAEEEGYHLINQPRSLAMMLLSDQVFLEAPKVMKRLVDFVAEGPGFDRLVAGVGPRRRQDFALAAKAGGNALFEACRGRLGQQQDPWRRKSLRAVMAMNAAPQARKSVWLSRFEESLMKCDPLQEAKDFGVLNQITAGELAQLAPQDAGLRFQWLATVGNYDAIVRDGELYAVGKEQLFEGNLEPPIRWHRPQRSLTVLETLFQLLRPPFLAGLFTMDGGDVQAHVTLDREFFSEWYGLVENARREYRDASGGSLESFALFVAEMLTREVSELQKSLEPWGELVDRGFEMVPSNHLMVRIAMIATASSAQPTVGVWDGDGFKATRGLVNRLFFARYKANDARWWENRLAETTDEARCLCLSILLLWGKVDVIVALKAEIEKILARLSSGEWSHFWSLASLVAHAAKHGRQSISEACFKELGSMSPRLAFVLINRVEKREAARRLSRAYFVDYSGDDGVIVRRAVEIELFGPERDEVVDWDYVRHLSQRAKQIGVQARYRVPSSRIPETVAETVLGESEKHSVQLVTICEKAYSTVVAQGAPKISDVAEIDEWFTPSD